MIALAVGLGGLGGLARASLSTGNATSTGVEARAVASAPGDVAPGGAAAHDSAGAPHHDDGVVADLADLADRAGPEAASAGPVAASWWERRSVQGQSLEVPRPAPVVAAEGLGAVDPASWLAGSPYRPTHPQFRDRRFVTPTSPWLVDPVTAEFASDVLPVPDHVVRRSTWQEGCPVTVDELRWVKVTHVGFDGLAHAGELLVHRDAAEGMVEVFRRLYDARYPIEKMRIAGGRDFLRGPWWHGDDNTTTAFVCRMSTGGTRWSEHAFGKAVDVNPYHNPYLRTARTPDGEDLLIPPGAVHYLTRDDRPGIIHAGDEVTSAFRQELGWTWGGQWRSLVDYMHFSWNDR